MSKLLPEDKLRLGIPKGSLQESTLDLFQMSFLVLLVFQCIAEKQVA